MKTEHTPGPWHVEKSLGRYEIWPKDKGQAHSFIAVVQREQDAAPIAAVPELVEALRGLLAQLKGPVMVHGDGRGNDGRKTGLSGDEFNALYKKRIEAAQSVLADLGAEPDDKCSQCGEPNDNGEGWDGLCGNCADKAENDQTKERESDTPRLRLLRAALRDFEKAGNASCAATVSCEITRLESKQSPHAEPG